MMKIRYKINFISINYSNNVVSNNKNKYDDNDNNNNNNDNNYNNKINKYYFNIINQV